MTKNTIAIVGSRTFTDIDLIRSSLEGIDPKYHKIISGGAKGADTLAKIVANELGFEFEEFPADWDKYGKQAGPIRNSMLVELSQYVFAFWDGKSRGTMDTVLKAIRADKFVQLYIDGVLFVERWRKRDES